MKLKTIILISFISLFMGIHSQIYAQKVFNDTIMVFNEDAGFQLEKLDIGNGDLAKPFVVTPQTRSSMKKISAQTAKQMGLPYSVKSTTRPITLKYRGNCYQFGCQASSTCKDCKMYWMDRNGDRKVQPRRELRCMCSKGKKCRIRVRRVKCN